MSKSAQVAPIFMQWTFYSRFAFVWFAIQVFDGIISKQFYLSDLFRRYDLAGDDNGNIKINNNNINSKVWSL